MMWRGAAPNVRSLRSACRSDLATPAHMNVGKVPYWMPEFAAQVREIGYQDETMPAVSTPTPEDDWEFVSRLIHRGPASARDEFVRPRIRHEVISVHRARGAIESRTARPRGERR